MPNPEQMRMQLAPALEFLTQQQIVSDVDREKVVQYSDIRRNHLYWEGKQFLYPVVLNGQVVDFSAASGSLLSTSPSDAQNRAYDYVINYIRGDGRKFIAVVGQRAPNVKARPNRPKDEHGLRLARRADEMAALLRSHWAVEQVHRQICLSLWKNGTTFVYTPYVSNGDLYGFTEEPQIEAVPGPIGEDAFHCMVCGATTPVSQMPLESGACPQCGSPLGPESLQPAPKGMIPQVTGTQRYPNGSVEIHVASGMEVTTLFYVRNLRQAPWLWYEYMEHRSVLLQIYPQLRAMLKDESPGPMLTSSSAGQVTRDIASSPNSTLMQRANRWLYQRFWLRPGMYQLLLDQHSQQMTLLQENFPKGIKCTYVAGKLVQVEHEAIDEVWTAFKPETSEYLYCAPLCTDYLGPQDVINDTTNIMIEWLQRAIPLTAIDPTVFDIDMLRRYSATPMEFIPAKAGVGASIKDAMQTLPVAKPEPQMQEFGTQVREEARQIVGILPAIFGGDAGPQQTAREAELKRNQAMAQLGTTWNEMRTSWAEAYAKGVKQLAKHAGDRVWMLAEGSQEPTQYEISDLSELGNGGWHFDAEEAMPMTWGQRRDVIWDLIGKGPEVWGMLGLNHPANLPVVQEAMGLPDYHTPGLAMRDKVMDTIQKLLKEPPHVTQTINPMTGLPMMDVQPSIPIDPSGIEEDHAIAVAVVSEWAADEEGRRAKEDPATSEGYANVIAWARQHLQAMTPPPMPAGEGEEEGNKKPGEAPNGPQPSPPNPAQQAVGSPHGAPGAPLVQAHPEAGMPLPPPVPPSPLTRAVQ